MKIIKFANFDLNRIKNLANNHINTNVNINNGYVFIDENDKILGYTIFKEYNNNIKIEWIYAKHGYGTEFLHRIERSLFKKYNKIFLNCSIDPNEKKDTVINRINFYIKNNYRIYDIEFRNKNGPLFKMFKNK